MTNKPTDAVAYKGGKFFDVGSDYEIKVFRNVVPSTVDFQRGTVIFGLNDSHLQLIRGGLNYKPGRRIESAERRFQQQGVGLLIRHHPMQVAGH